MTRFFVRQEMIENGATELDLREFDALTEPQFELWFKLCYTGKVTKGYI